MSRRPLKFEPLEGRRVLATFAVTTPVDVVDDFDGLVSLREAVAAANANGGVDQINFAPGAFAGGASIRWELADIAITEDLVIESASRFSFPIATDTTIESLLVSETDSATDAFGVTILEAASAVDTDVLVTGNQINLTRQGADLVVRRRDVEVFRVADALVSQMLIRADEFSSVLTVDQSGGEAIPSGGLVFDGGDRVNTFRWIGGGADLDLTAGGNVTLLNVSAIDITDANTQTIVIDSLAAIAAEGNQNGIIINGGGEDAIVFADGSAWRMREPSFLIGDIFNEIAIAETFILTNIGGGWQNMAQPGDVNNSGDVTANDALVIINELAARVFSDRETRVLVDPAGVDPWPNFYFDQNGDGQVSALDALRVINQLAQIDSGGGESELIAPFQFIANASNADRRVADSDEDDLPSLF